MHLIFWPYGIKDKVEFFLKQLETQFYSFYWTNPETGERARYPQDVQGSVRTLPGGFIDYIIPVEHANMVMTSLKFNQKDERYEIPEKVYGMPVKALLRKFLKCEQVPKFEPTRDKYLWALDYVAIIPVGVKYDAIVQENDKRHGKWTGWKHEGL